MRRARHPLPFELRGMRHDPQTGKYYITENGITYSFTLEHSRLLKEYFRKDDSRGKSIANWYDDLDRFTRKEIHKTLGNDKNIEHDFYPDSF